MCHQITLVELTLFVNLYCLFLRVALIIMSLLPQIKKFRDALAKHTPDRCSLGPTEGLEEKELLALSANKDLSFNYTPKPFQPALVPVQEEIITETAPSHPNPEPLPLPSTILKSAQDLEEKSLVTAGR